MKTTPEQRADLRADVSGPWGRYMLAEDLRALLDDLDEVLAELAALRAVAEAARAVCTDSAGVDVICEGVLRRHMAALRAAMRAWEERER